MNRRRPDALFCSILHCAALACTGLHFPLLAVVDDKYGAVRGAPMMTGFEIDSLLKWPKGRAERLARQGRLPHYVLPDGKSIRFKREDIEALIERRPALERVA